MTTITVKCGRCGGEVEHRPGAQAPSCKTCPPEPLNRAEYIALRELIVRISGTLAQIPTDQLRRLIFTADRASAIGPIVDSTLARDAGANLEQEIRLFRAVRELRDVIEEIRDA